MLPLGMSAATPVNDWAGLPAAIKASKCGAINHQIVKAADFDSVLTLVRQKRTELNSVNVATALHRVAIHTKRNRADRDRMLRDPRFISLLDSVQECAPECNPRSVSDVMWAFATMQHWPPTMLKPMLTQVTSLPPRAL